MFFRDEQDDVVDVVCIVIVRRIHSDDFCFDAKIECRCRKNWFLFNVDIFVRCVLCRRENVVSHRCLVTSCCWSLDHLNERPPYVDWDESILWDCIRTCEKTSKYQRTEFVLLKNVKLLFNENWFVKNSEKNFHELNFYRVKTLILKLDI